MGWDLESLPLRHQQAIREELFRGCQQKSDGSFPETERHPQTDSESDLHDHVIEWCRAHALYVVHSRMDRRTTQARGVPDFIIAFPHGVTLWLELKRLKQKPTPEQSGSLMALGVLGHINTVSDNWPHALGILNRTLEITKGTE